MSNNIFINYKEYNKLLESDSKVEEIINKGFNILGNDINLTKEPKLYSSDYFSKCPEEEQKKFLNYLACYVYVFVCDRVNGYSGSTKTMDEVYHMVIDESYKNIIKNNRKLIYPTQQARQAGSSKNWMDWNGFQVIDLDIKNINLSNIFKPLLFNYLKSQKWFLGITKSASGSGIHIWTKIKPQSLTPSARIKEYQINFRHKFSYVYCCLEQISYYISSQQEIYNFNDDIISTEKMLTWIDKAMCKITQGAYIPYDPTAELNTNFRDLSIDLESNERNWKNNAVLKELFTRFNYFSSENNERDNIDKSAVEFNPLEITNQEVLNKIHSKHYKHQQRYKLANTLCKLYGKEQAIDILVKICGAFTSKNELVGIVNTAATHDKALDKWAIDELNKVHGFNIKIKNNLSVEKIVQEQSNQMTDRLTPTSVLNVKGETIEINISKDQYLSDIKDKILSSCSNLTLIESGAGTGKTEMIKRLNGRVLMVLPFTSIIKSKIELDPLGDDWLSFYHNKTPRPEDFASGKNMVMTLDKFSRLSVAEIEINHFDYIVIDESHLVFISSFRDVVYNVIQIIANIYKNVPVMLFTGTPTGEQLFFEGITHIKITKEDDRDKQVRFFMCHKEEEQTYEMCKHMAESIENGKHILFPTNAGIDKFNQICNIVQRLLLENHSSIQLKTFYYKKSNSGKADMERINRDKSIGDNHIIGCTTFLSVGVDICDRYDFEIFFNELWIPQDIEQFANRIRKNNLYVNVYLKQFDSNDSAIDYSDKIQLNLTVDKETYTEYYEYAQLLNSIAKRNGIANSYNPIAKSIENQYNFIQFDSVDNEWYVNPIGYLVSTFEDNYRQYISQLPVVIQCMQYYGYQTKVINIAHKLTEDRREKFHELVHDIKAERVSNETVETFKWLACLNDESFEMFKHAVENIEELNSDFFRDQCEMMGLYLPENNEIVINNIGFIKTFQKWYDYDVIQEIYEACTAKRTNRISMSALKRIKEFIILENQRLKMNIDLPFYKLIKESYDWFTTNSEISENLYESKKAELLMPYVNSIDNLYVSSSETGGDKVFAQKINSLYDKVFKILFNVKKSKGMINISPFKPLWSFKESINNVYIDPTIKAILGDTLVNSLIESSKKENTIENSPDKDLGSLSSETDELLTNFSFGQGSRVGLERVVPQSFKNSEYDYEKVAYTTDLDGKSVNDRFTEQQDAIWTVKQNQYKNVQQEVLEIINGISEDNLGLFSQEDF